ncbi:PTS sugar transporter subunit IIA [Thomasclavelia spiroformis]|uniref:PTS sugar transporter subunit IIA n=1 Tax=Thomasclavelia spiroformis TaxID=29348 RepID=UPI0024B1AA4B|nr:PTS sugar transporter subunit IIA [Thomasclavelia spiroformis]
MTGILVVTHGKMAEGMLDTLDMIMGTLEYVDYASLVRGEDCENFEKNIENKVRALNNGDGVLILVDLFGASPFNVSQKVSKKLEAEDIKTKIVSGVNLMMLLEASSNRSYQTLEELVETVKNSGKDGILEPIVVIEDDGDEDY